MFPAVTTFTDVGFPVTTTVRVAWRFHGKALTGFLVKPSGFVSMPNIRLNVCEASTDLGGLSMGSNRSNGLEMVGSTVFRLPRKCLVGLVSGRNRKFGRGRPKTTPRQQPSLFPEFIRGGRVRPCESAPLRTGAETGA